MLITTNSAGLSGAKPTRMFTTPRSMSYCVVVSASQRTKNASRGLEPWKAPLRNRVYINAPIEARSWAHSGASLGSNTAHCVLRYSVSSMKSASRRTGTYL